MDKFDVCVIAVDHEYRSIFSSQKHSLTDHSGMLISDRQSALNLRHRKSLPGYKSDWHVAGDPTLIIIRQGQLTIYLRSGESRTFSAGEQFIAADYLPVGMTPGPEHGHSARVDGDEALIAVHIKLSDDPEKWYAQQNLER